MRRLLSVLSLTICSLHAQDDLAARGVRVLEQKCWGCHGPNLAQSGLRLDSREAALKGGARGAALVPGNAAQSRIIQAVRRTGELSMPPGPKLSDAEIAAIESWIAAGAAWPTTAGPASPRFATSGPATARSA